MKKMMINPWMFLCCVLVCGGIALAQAQPNPAPAPAPALIEPRTDPVLTEQAAELKLKTWIADLPEGEKPEIVWVRTIWGRTVPAYNKWEKKAEWGDSPNWWYTWTDVAAFRGKLICTFTERNEGHNRGDTILHVIVSDDDGANWKSVAHYELSLKQAIALGVDNSKGGLFYGYLTQADGKLAMSSLTGGGNGNMFHAFSEDGLTWSPATAWKTKDTLWRGEVFRPAWNKGKCYGFTRGGEAVSSADGLNFERITLVDRPKGGIASNETASTFVGDTWIVFDRSGRIGSSKPPYNKWTVNETNKAGGNDFGGPNIKAIPTGEVIAGSRWQKLPDMPRDPAVVFRYDGKTLTPLLGFESGSTATAYPGLAWHEGHLYVSFMTGGDGASDRGSRGRIALAKIKWPKEGLVKFAEPAATQEAPQPEPLKGGTSDGSPPPSSTPSLQKRSNPGR